MSFLRSLFGAPASVLFRAGVRFRHWLYDSGINESYVPEIPVISVGNITVGGTGKTPFTEYLIQMLSPYYEVAVLSRGYKRRTSGFILADSESDFRKIGDEPAQIKLKYPSVHVAVCEDRVSGILKLRELVPSVNLIILDDAFQHRRVKPWADIVMMDYNRPIYEDHMLPWGMLRDVPEQLKRAEFVITSKCPSKLPAFDAKEVELYLNLYPYQNLFFTAIKSERPVPLFPVECMTRNDDGTFSKMGKDTPAIVMTGIASPGPFLEHVASEYSLQKDRSLIFPDHHAFKMRDLQDLQEVLKRCPKDTVVFITEKDAVRLCGSTKINPNIRKRLYYIGISHRFLFGKDEEFKKKLLSYVESYKKDSYADPREK